MDLGVLSCAAGLCWLRESSEGISCLTAASRRGANSSWSMPELSCSLTWPSQITTMAGVACIGVNAARNLAS